MDWHRWILLFLLVAAFAEINGKRLAYLQHSKCTYSYEVSVYTARGSKSTESDGCQIHALVDLTFVSREHDVNTPLYLFKLDVREPRLRRALFGRMTSYPVIDQFEEQLSKPFYFRQKEHGAIVDVLFPKDTESLQVAAFKKGIVGAFQVNLQGDKKSTNYEVQEHDDSGVFRTKYNVLSANETHAHLHRTWTNHDYQQFADGTPVKGEHKVQSQHSVHVHLKEGKVERVHRSTKAFFRPPNRHPRAENFKDFQKQDIEISTSGYSKLRLRSCSDPTKLRSKRSIIEKDHSDAVKSLTRDSIVFTDADKINWWEIGGEKKQKRRLHEVLRCFVDNSIKEWEVGNCSSELHFMVRSDESVFQEIKRLVENRNHQNVTSWGVYVSALAAHGKYEAQNALAQAVKMQHPRPLNSKEYETLLLSIHYLPKGPLHSSLFEALSELAFAEEKGDHITATAMLVLAGLTERAITAGYNETLSDSVAEMIYRRYRNKSSIYYLDTTEHEMQLRDHIWAFGNLGHQSGLPVIMGHIDHDDSSIRSAVISAMRKMPEKYTHQHLLRALYQDEQNEVKAAVVSVFIDRHQSLSDSVVQGLEHAMWYAERGDTLDSAIHEFLENHGNHSKAAHLRKRRNLIHRQKRASFPASRPREFDLGPVKRWAMDVGGEWLGGEAALQFANKIKLRITIFGGRFEVNLDNFAEFQAHLLGHNFKIAKGKAAFKTSASFKNDFPKDLIHTVDVSDDLLRQFESISSVVAKEINKIKTKLAALIPLQIDKFTDFVKIINQFLQNVKIPLQAIKGVNKVISFSKDVAVRVNRWKSLIKGIAKIQQTLLKLTGFETQFKNALNTLDKIVKAIAGISKYLPNNLPKRFSIKNLLQTLRKASLSQQTAKIKEYFLSLGSSVPDGFSLQLPFKLSIYFSLSLAKFQKVLSRMQRFSNSLLDMSSSLNTLEGIHLSALRLPFLKSRAPAIEGSGFNFGLTFSWNLSLKFNLQVKQPDFQSFITILGEIGDFFSQFTHPNFDLEKFFEEILSGEKCDFKTHFPDLYRVNQRGKRNSSDPFHFLRTRNSTGPSDVLQTFLNVIRDLLDSKSLSITAVSNISDFFQELGPTVTQFAERNLQKICRIHKTALDYSREFKDYDEKIDSNRIVLKEIDNVTQRVLKELVNFTAVVDALIDEIEQNFTSAAETFASDSLQNLTDKIRYIQELADGILEFTNGNASKENGACFEAASFTADVIDEVQTDARQALDDLTSFIGPVATNIKIIGTNLKSAVTKVETWYEENLTHPVGRISRVAQIISDFLSILNTRKGFLDTANEIASRLYKVLKSLRNIPEYSIKARKTVEEVINFANRAQDCKDEIQKLDIRKQFRIDFDQRVRSVCNEFQTTTDALRSAIGITEVNSFLNKEASSFIDKAVSKFRSVKHSVNGIQREIQDVRSMVSEALAVLADLKPFIRNFLPILVTAARLPDCQQTETLFKDSTKPCVHKALVIGRSFVDQYQDLKREIDVFYRLVPEAWKNVKSQKCVKGGTCISKAFTEQGKVVESKLSSIKHKLEEAIKYNDLLKMCEDGVNNITTVADVMKLLIQQVQNVFITEKNQRVVTMLKRINGRKQTERESWQNENFRYDAILRMEGISDYFQKAEEIEKRVQDFQENTFQALRSVQDDAVRNYVESINVVHSKLQLSYQLWQTTTNVDNVLKALDKGAKSALTFADKLADVVTSFSNPTINLLADATELTEVIKPQLDKYTLEVTETVVKVNGFIDKISDFLTQIQTRQRGLNPRAYKLWQEIPYCSESVCLRSIRRSSSLYLSTTFTWKFPHVDDLSSVQKSGRWLTPGLFDDYKVEGISQLSKNEMILGMYGVASNQGKASLLVVTNFDRGVKKIIQLTKQNRPLSVKIGGIAIARHHIWVSNRDANEILLMKISAIKSTLSSPKPSRVDISKTVSVKGTADSVSYDDQSNVLWVTSSKAGKAYGYKLTESGNLDSFHLAPDRVINIGENAQGMAIVRQFGNEYACISKCAMIVGFQCKLEFHDLSLGLITGENTLARVVRTPYGLESVTRIDNEVIAVAFSSGTFAEKENVELIGGDYEERYFKLRVPILKTTFGITENCLYFALLGNYVLRPQKILPIGDMICGSKRKRSLSQELLETDVYHENFEDIHKKSKRVRRDVADSGSCMSSIDESLVRGSHTFFEVSTAIPVFGITVGFFAGATGHYRIGYQVTMCIKNKVFKLGLTPGVWINVYAGASVAILIVEAGVTIEARLLETSFIPELRVEIGTWPLQTCIQLRQLMIPLKIRVYLWYRFRIKIKLKVWLIGADIGLGWTSKKTFKEWTWSAKQIDRILFTNCKTNVDRTSPVAGSCSARQAADTKYLIQWFGFQEDTKISDYHVKIGSIKGSGDDYSSWVGTSLSHLATDLNIMDGRDVFVSVRATNDEKLDSSLVYCPVFQARRKTPKIRFVYDGTTIGTDSGYQSDTFSLGMNFALESDFSEIANLKWGASSQSSCMFDESESDVVPMMSVGDSNAIQVSGLNLKHGKKYFTRLYALDTIGLKTVMCSDGILIDTTPPIPVTFQDGAGKTDATFLPSLRRVRGKFDPFIDPESPIVRYEWKVVSNVSGEDVTPFITIPVTQQTPLMEGLSLDAGSPYRLVLCGTNAAGLQAVIETNGFIPDSTLPTCEGSVVDVADEMALSDIDVVRELSSIQAKWKCFDRESGIRSQMVGVGTYPGGDDVKAFEELGFLSHIVMENGISYVQFSNMTIDPRVRYHVTVKVINGASLKRTISSDGILFDTTPPNVAPEYIKDGEGGKDKNFSSERFAFSAHWEQAFADAESGVVKYRVGLGTEPGLDDIKNFNTVGSQTNVTLTGMLLESGQRYYVTVVGCNKVGMCANASSNGATVDFVPPNSGKIITGFKGPPVFYQWMKKSVWARWNWCLADKKRIFPILNSSQCSNESFYDIHTGIGMFGLSVMSQKTNQLVAPFKSVGLQRYSGRNVDLEDGVYSVSIKASDKAGVTSRGFSNTFIVDSSPPLITVVQHGHFAEIMEYVNKPIITFRSFFVAEEDLSLVTAYQIGVGSYSGADDVINFETFSLRQSTSLLRSNWTSLRPTYIENNRRYYITILVKNSAGLFTMKSSRPLLSDFEAPQNGFVMDGWGLDDAKYQSLSSLYRAHWYGFTDFSGIKTVYLGLSSKPNSTVCDIKVEEVVSSFTDFHVLSGLALISGKKYYACLKLIDSAGNSALFYSNGVVIDNSPPLPGYVNDGMPGQEIDVQIESSVLKASWGNFTESETRIVSFQLAFGSFPGEQDIQEFTNVGLVNTATSSKLKVPELATGHRYYATVIAFNVLGMPSSMVSSNGVLVDFTPPVFSQPVRDGGDPSYDLNYTSESVLKATWRCHDPQTNLSSVEIAFGLQPGETDALNFVSLSVTQTSFITNAKLQSGYRYFSTVRCTNKVGLTVVLFSDGLVYDDSPPDLVYIDDGNYQRSNRTVFATFKFVDAESSVQAYQVYIWGRDPPSTSSDVYDSFRFDGNVTDATLQLTKDLASGKMYYINVTAVNGIGLETTRKSDGFLVDTTPPICSQVWDGLGDYQHDKEYAPSSSRFLISWVCHDNESPIVRYRLSVKNVHTSDYVIPFYALRTHVNSSGSAFISGGGRSNPRFVEGHTYAGGIEVINAVGMKMVYWTNGVLIDSTPPVVTGLKVAYYPKEDFVKADWLVSDKQSGLKSLTWGLGTTPETNDIKNYTFISPSSRNVSISSRFFKQGLTCFVNILAVNNAGLLSRASSSAIVVDRSAPNAGVVAAYYSFPPTFDQNMSKVPNSSVVVTWTGFHDPESGIKKTSWAIGTNRQKLQQDEFHFYTEVVPDESVGGVIIRNLTLAGNETYFVCVRATNGAGLNRTDCSPGLLVILGQLSAGVVSDGPLITTNDIDFQLDDKAIWAHWDGFKDPVFDISRYDWCITEQLPNPSRPGVCKWPFMEINRLKTTTGCFHNLTLTHGTKYYVAVKAHNTRGDTVISSSDGVVVDRTPPVAKSIHISPSTGQETVFLTSPSAPVVTWSIDDPESGISHFLVRVGSFPFKSDLLTVQRVDKLSRSLDLDLLNLTLYEGMTFYVTVTGFNMLGLETTLISHQVVVDWTPPEFGEDVGGNQTLTQAFIGGDYQINNGMLFAHWDGIQDSESDVIEYQWCLGTSQGNCEVKGMTSADRQTSVRHIISFQEGLQYFFTVEATNGAGLKQAMSSDGIIVDTSPPVIAGVYHGVESEGNDVPQVMFQSVGDQLVFYWDKPFDKESGISSVAWCAAANNNSCDVIPLISVDIKDTSVKYSMSKSLASGTVVYIMVIVTNGAGMTTKVVSPPLLIDITPPSVGNVAVGNSAETKYFRQSDLIAAEWHGFVDEESRIDHFEWATCQASVKDACRSSYVKVGLKTTTKIDALGLDYGVSYVVVTRAFNKAGNFREATSNQFILDGTGPAAGTVYDGLQRRKDIEFQSSTAQLSANWSPFTDNNGEIAEYEMCVGIKPGTCDVSDFLSFGIKLSGTISGLSLKHNKKYFVTVRATSECGHSTTATSNGVRVDNTPAIKGLVRDGQTLTDIDYQADETRIYANWDQFQDEESDVTSYTWCAGTVKGICDIVPETDVGDRTSAGQQILPVLPEGIAIFVTVSTLNSAGASTTSSSDGFTVDSTYPILLKVLDLQLGFGEFDVDYLTIKENYCVSWVSEDPESGIVKNEISVCSALGHNECLLHRLDVSNQTSHCIADLEFKEGVMYMAKIRTENKAGLSTELFSDGFIVDTTPPFMGEVTFIKSSKITEQETTETFIFSQISVHWSGFWDKESGIRTCYACVGTQQGECNIKNFTDTSNSTSFTFQDLPLDQGEKYFVSVKAKNKAGLISDLKTSDAVVVDKTGPVGGVVILDGSKEGDDIDVQESKNSIAAHWLAFEDPDSDVIKVKWCAGSSSGACDVVKERQLKPESTFVREVLKHPMLNGLRYFVTVSATNSAGVTTSLTSDGVTVDDTPPIPGSVIDGIVSDVDFLNGEDDINAHWFGFVDLESSIESYQVALCDVRNLSSCPQPFLRVGEATNVSITGLDLEKGVHYILIVRAFNFAGLKVDASSDGFTVDFSPPMINKAWIGTDNGHALYQSDSTKMVVSWIPFIDLESGVAKYEVCLSSVVENCTVTTFIDVGLNTSNTINGLHLEHGKTYYAIVRGTNGIGISMEVASSGVWIDLTPPFVKNDENLSDKIQIPSTLPPSVKQSIPRIMFRCLEEHLMSSWAEFEDQESGVVEYNWCVGTGNALCDVVSLKSVGMKTRGAATVNRLRSGMTLFSTVYAVNGAKLRTHITSDPCTVITVASKVDDVIDISGLNTSNFTDIDWKAGVQSLSLSWKVTERHLNKASRQRVQVAVTRLSSNLSVPRLIDEKSWNGEPLKQPFMDIPSWQTNITIQSVPFQPWNRYRGIVRVWNEGGIYSQGSSDGVKLEPNPPPERSITIRDKAAEKEHLRWWPNLRLPPLNQITVDPDITYIASPADLEVMVSSSVSNETSSKTDYSFDHRLFSPTAEYKIVVRRMASDVNNTNTTQHSRTMKHIPGFSDDEGPCCKKYSAVSPVVFSNTHLKPALPTEDFGVSIAVLPNDNVAIGCKDKVVIQSLQSQAVSQSLSLEDHSDAVSRVKISSHGNRTGFLLNGKLYLYEYSGNNDLRKTIEIGNCKSVSISNCSKNERWADNISLSFAVNEHVVAVAGTKSDVNNSVVAVFLENAGGWTFVQELGQEKKHPNFGQSIALNDRFIAIAAGEGKTGCVFVYAIPTLGLCKTICLAESSTYKAPLSIYLTETDALVVLSRASRMLKVFQLNFKSSSHHVICEYGAWVYKDELSGNLDVNTRDEGSIVALGIQTGDGSDGVQLIGFQGIYSNIPYKNEGPGQCANLGLVLARDTGFRVDGTRTRASVSFKGTTVLFGLPSIFTWPQNDQWSSTGRVFMVTYCPLNHFRTRVSGLDSLRSMSCLPCKNGSKSFGGFAETCTVCAGRMCSPSSESYIFKSGICDATSCVSPTFTSNITNGINFQFVNGSFFVPGSGNVYTVEVVETTRAGLSTSSLSESFVVDPTAPEVGVVYDGLGSDQNMNCSKNTTFGENSQCSTRNFEDTDVNFTNNTREIHARWIDFLDKESDIVEYFWCVGTQPMKDDIRACESTGMKPNGSHFGLSLQHGDSYYITIIACNGARMCSAAHSDGVTIDTTPPVMRYVRDGVMGPDMDYQVFIDIIFAYFFANDPESGVTSYEVAWGTEPNLVDISDFEEVLNITVWRAKLKDGALEVGKKYYATVRATNGAGLLSEKLSSDGIIVGKSEYISDNSTTASFFFDTVNVKDDGTRKDGGVKQTYGTLSLPAGAVKEEVKLRCYSLNEKTLSVNKTEEGPISNPAKTKPKQFLLGNYSFLIKALDPLSSTVQEGYKFVKPIKISMFYDVGNLVKANRKHVNNELIKEDVEPVLYLWNPDNETWSDAALTCPEPWSHVNRSIKMLEVNVCHLTQFAFFWSFDAKHGLILFDKNHSVYGSDGYIEVKRVQNVTKLEIPVRRSKGSQGNITVKWSVYHNDSTDGVNVIWPASGKLSMTDGQWNDSFTVNVANDRKELPESVVWVQLEGTTGGALLASRNETITKILIASTMRQMRVHEKSSTRITEQEENKVESNCKVSLPQHCSGNCKTLREKELGLQRGIYQLAPRENFPMPLVNMSIEQLKAYHLQDAFAKEQFVGYTSMLLKNKGVAEKWRAQHPEEITEFQEYENMFKELRSKLASNGSSGFYRFASNTEPFRDLLEYWRDDDIFAEQRLSGCNPMVLRRVTDNSSEVGLNWSELSKTLNPNYNWEAAIQAASGTDDPLEEAIGNGNVYVLRYEVFDDMVSFNDTEDHNPGRTLWPSKSPVALFAMKSDDQDRRLRPAAVQIDHKPDSPVFSPVDGGSWMLAKMVVQATDYAHSQIIEHLLKIHLLAEPFCVVLYRQLSNMHPLNELLKYHCRGLIATNTIGSLSLLKSGGYMDQLTPTGHEGTVLLVERGYKTLSWKDADFHLDIKKRGLDDKKMLPYFPYRDDSELLLLTIRRMVEDYVSTYYTLNRHVREDKELQAFVNELSAEGTGPDGGRGQVKDFPAVLNTRNEVVDIVTKLLWLLSVKHAAVNYPVSDYGAFTPLLPTKIYNDTRVPPGEFSIFNLPNGNISSMQIEVAMNIGTYHYDTLFDYYKKLSNPLASRIVGFYYYYLKYAISPRLQYRNKKRFRSGHLTYPYLQHHWVPNGIQT